MSVILIIICCVIYYVLGWVLFNILTNRYFEYIDEPEFYMLLSMFGLGIITILRVLYFVTVDIINHHNKYNEILVIENTKLSQSGIQKYKNKIIYNFAESSYYGYLDIDASRLDYKSMDKIITKLSKWADEEKMKQARLSAIKEFNN